MTPFHKYMRRGSAKGFILGIIFALAVLFFLFVFLSDDEEGGNLYVEDDGSSEDYIDDESSEDYVEDGDISWYDDEEDDSWYTDDEDYDEDNDVWDAWKIQDEKKRAKKAKLHGSYGDGLFKSEKELRSYVKQTADDINNVWAEVFKEYKKKYRKPKLKTFSGDISTGCGDASSEDGPFYCSEDETVYLDLNFLANMSDEIGTTGTFAIAYVIAHEYGHHVQHLTGDLEKYGNREMSLRERGKEKKANLLSVQSELQADFYAGIWANRYDERTDKITEKDIEDSLNAAIAVGDDALGEESRENFGHGSSEMRMRWLIRGMATGNVLYGNTYELRSLKKLENVDMMLDDE